MKLTFDFFQPLSHPVFRWMFAAQLVSLLGTGLTTIGLALLAYQLQPESAGLILGIAMATKMLAYLTIAPIAGVIVNYISRKIWLTTLNIIRALVIIGLLFTHNIWQLYLIIFVLNALTACYTPVFQAALPDVLPEKEDYVAALSLSRFAMEIENLLSPTIAALCLLFLSFNQLFLINAIGFMLAAGFLLLIIIPNSKAVQRTSGVWHKLSFGIKSYLKTPRLRGVLAINLALSAGGSMVIINSVVLVKTLFELDDSYVPLLMLAGGVGAVVSAVFIPRLLSNHSDRQVMLAGAIIILLALLAGSIINSYIGLFPIWFFIGAANSLILIPTGNVLRDSCLESDRNEFFSANFSLTHGMWLLTYLIAGFLGKQGNMPITFISLSLVVLLAVIYALKVWKINELNDLSHEHEELDHEHLHYHGEHHQHEHHGDEGPEPHHHSHRHPKVKHKHRFVIDEHHINWPKY